MTLRFKLQRRREVIDPIKLTKGPKRGRGQVRERSEPTRLSRLVNVRVSAVMRHDEILKKVGVNSSRAIA